MIIFKRFTHQPPDMDLFISSGAHANTDVESRVDEICEQVPDAEVLFVEAPSDTISRENEIKSFFYSPMFFIIAFVLIKPRVLLNLFGGSDDDIIESVKNEDMDLVPVDIPHYRLIYQRRHYWSIISYSVLILSFSAYFSFPHFNLIHVLLFTLFMWAIIFFTYILTIHIFRDKYMSNVILNHSKNHDQACLITGSEHHEGIAEELSLHDSVTVINSRPN